LNRESRKQEIALDAAASVLLLLSIAVMDIRKPRP
jgi:hypothetical protein